MNWSISTNIFSNPLAVTDPDCDPSVRESVWTQWIKPCKIPHFSLTKRTYLTRKRSISRTDSSWQSWGQRFDPAYLHHVKSLEIMRFQGFFVVCPLPWNCTTPVIMESVWNPFGLSAQKSVLSSCSVYFRKAFSELFRLLSDFREKFFSWNFK